MYIYTLSVIDRSKEYFCMEKKRTTAAIVLRMKQSKKVEKHPQYTKAN